MNLDTTLPTTSRIYLLSFIISAFQSLEIGLVRKECAPLVSISLWQNLFSEDYRYKLLEESGSTKKAWRAASKRYDAADELGKARIRFERSWLYSMLLDFLRRLHAVEDANPENVRYCERFMEFLVDLDSQLPTRRYVNSLLKDLNILPVIRLSRLFNDEENGLFRDFCTLLRHFVNFAIDDHTGQHRSPQTVHEIHCQALAQLQRMAIEHFKDKLTILALSNYGSIEQRSELENHLSSLDESELERLCSFLDFRTVYPRQANISPNR